MSSLTPETPTAQRRISGETAYRALKIVGLFAGVAALVAIALQLGELNRTVGYLAHDETLSSVAGHLEGIEGSLKAQEHPAPDLRASAAERSMIEELFREGGAAR